MSLDLDWTSYTRVHGDRRNLLIHAFAVPLFAVSFLFLIYFLIRGAYVFAVIALFTAIAAMAMQGRGHALEAHAPEPFAGPGDFLRRWFKEQFLVFPVFILTGRWWQQFRASRGAADGAA